MMGRRCGAGRVGLGVEGIIRGRPLGGDEERCYIPVTRGGVL